MKPYAMSSRMQRLPRALMLAPALVALAMAGCANMTPEQQATAKGAAIGAVTGAVLGKVTGGKPATGAAIGGVIGAVAGNVWSRNMEEQKRAMEAATQGTPVEVTRTADNQLKLDIPSDISFDRNSAAIKPELRSVLDAFARGARPRTAAWKSSCANRADLPLALTKKQAADDCRQFIKGPDRVFIHYRTSVPLATLKIRQGLTYER